MGDVDGGGRVARGTEPRVWAVVALLLALGLPSSARAQEGGEPSCTLRWESLTDSTGSRSIQEGPDQYRHHVWNGMRWTCGGAVMTADSAVQFPRSRVEMVGDVHYRDSVRTLDALRLTYFQVTDLVEARDSVRLIRRATGSTLRAPSVDFYRAGSGEIRQTVATGGTRMEVYPPADSTPAEDPREERRPFHVTSDTALILEEDVTLARGDVVVTREGMRGTGAFGRFDTGAGQGMLTGDPVLTGEEYRLTGDSVRIATEDGDLREVRADGAGHLESEDLDVRAPRIRIAVDGDRVRTLWAFGGGARSRSATRLMLGDSLHVAFREGRPDSTTAVGEAAAVELAPDDTLRMERLLASRAGEGRPDTAAGEARPDTAAGEARPDTAAAAAGDTAAQPPRPQPPPPESAAAAAAGVPDDTAAPGTASLFGLERDWIRGDTVRAYFSRADTAAVADTAARDVTLRELRATGSGRAYYRVARDTATNRPGRNYLAGREITVLFRQGDPHRVLGEMAIGVYLEPAAAGQGSAPGPVSRPDTGAAMPDSIPAREVGPEQGGAGVDTAAAASDSAAAADTTGRRRPW